MRTSWNGVVLIYSRILGIDVACIEWEGLLRQVGVWVSATPREGGLPRTLSYVNAHCLNIASRNQTYFNHLRAFDLIYPDGIGAVWAGHWLGGAHLHKMTGADWIASFCAKAQTSGWRLYILAGKPGVAQKARDNLLKQYPGLQILGVRDGYFSEAQSAEVLAEIAAVRPDVLFVGLGVPLQEAWISQWKVDLPVKICWAVGALFDYVAGVEPRAPKWMRRLGFEWLWRMLVDPWGKWKRYVLGNPLFFIRVVKQKLLQRRS